MIISPRWDSWDMPIRNAPGRPRKGEPPSPSRRRVVKVPLDLDQELERQAAARGVSYQAAVREAITRLLETWKGPEG